MLEAQYRNVHLVYIFVHVWYQIIFSTIFRIVSTY